MRQKMTKCFNTVKLRKNEAGSVAISGLLIVSILGMLSVYIYDLAQSQQQNLMVLKQGMAAKNFTVDRAQLMIYRYQNDADLWQRDCAKARYAYDFKQAINVDTAVAEDALWGRRTAEIYLMRYQEDIYILVITAAAAGIVNQNCVYLQEKDGVLSVQRWER